MKGKQLIVERTFVLSRFGAEALQASFEQLVPTRRRRGRAKNPETQCREISARLALRRASGERG